MFRARLFRLAAAAAGAGGRRCSPRGPRCSERAKVQCSCSVQCAEWAAAVRRPGRDVRARARPVGRCGRLAAGRSALHTHPDTQDTNSVEWHFYFRILWGADGSQQSICDTHTPQTRDRTSLALMLLSVLAQHAWSMGSG